MGVLEQAEYVARLVQRELSDQVDELHSEVHEATTSVQRLIQELSDRIDVLEKAQTPRAASRRSTGE